MPLLQLHTSVAVPENQRAALLGKLSTLIKSNVNDLIDSMQDPAKEIDQVVLDMEESARDARKEVAVLENKIITAEHRIDEIDAQLADAATYQTDGLARTLGDEKKSMQVDLSRFNRKWEEAVSRLARIEEKGSRAS